MLKLIRIVYVPEFNHNIMDFEICLKKFENKLNGRIESQIKFSIIRCLNKEFKKIKINENHPFLHFVIQPK